MPDLLHPQKIVAPLLFGIVLLVTEMANKLPPTTLLALLFIFLLFVCVSLFGGKAFRYVIFALSLLISIYLPSRLNIIVPEYYSYGVSTIALLFLTSVFACIDKQTDDRLSIWYKVLLFLTSLIIVLNMNNNLYVGLSLDKQANGLINAFLTQFLPIVLFTYVSRSHVSLDTLYRLLRLYVYSSIGILLFAIFISLFPMTAMNVFNWTDISLVQENFARTSSPFGGPGLTGIYSVTVFFLSIALYQMRKLSMGIFFTSICLSGTVILFSLTRSVVIAFILAGVSYVLIAPTKRKLIIQIATALLIFGVVLTVLLGMGFDLQRFTSFSIQNDESDMLRYDSILAAVDITSHHILIGSGIGVYYPRDGVTDTLSFGGYESARDPHNFYLMMLSEFGVVGFLILLAIYITPVLYSIRKLRSVRGDENSPVILGLTISILAILFYNLFSSSLAVAIKLVFVFWALNAYLVLFVKTLKKDREIKE